MIRPIRLNFFFRYDLLSPMLFVPRHLAILYVSIWYPFSVCRPWMGLVWSLAIVQLPILYPNRHLNLSTHFPALAIRSTVVWNTQHRPAVALYRDNERNKSPVKIRYGRNFVFVWIGLLFSVKFTSSISSCSDSARRLSFEPRSDSRSDCRDGAFKLFISFFVIIMIALQRYIQVCNLNNLEGGRTVSLFFVCG